MSSAKMTYGTKKRNVSWLLNFRIRVFWKAQ